MFPLEKNIVVNFLELAGVRFAPKNFFGAAKRRKNFFRPSKGVWGHAPPENFENDTSKIG